ncbi:MAG: P-loop NTPase [Chloroflexi bacterium]|nr:P-loop NTPase [Chloroflexota bacterium]
MEIKDLISLMWRNVRFLILGLAAGAVLGLLVANIETPVYEATTKVLISRTRQQSNADMLPLSDEQLLAINLQLAKAQPVLDDVSAKLGFKVDADRIQVSAVPNTLIVQIKVQDGDPNQAAMIANLLAESLIQKNETFLSARYATFEEAINSQLGQAQQQIDSLQAEVGQINDSNIQAQLAQLDQQIGQISAEISALEQDIAGAPGSPTPIDSATLAARQAQLDQLHTLMNLYQQIQANLTFTGKPGQGGSGLENPHLESIQSALDLYQQIYLNLVSSRESIHLAQMQSRQNVVQLVSATAPKKPVRPMPVLYILLAGLVGLIIAATVILIMDQFDSSLKIPGQTEALLGIPLMGLVSDAGQSQNGLVTATAPYSAEAEAFRALGSCMEITGTGNGIHTLLVVNAGQAEGKTTVAANLAIVNAQQGKKVILMDGDLKHPYIHSLFGMEIQKGLADFINDRLEVRNIFHVVENIAGLTLIPTGIAESDSTGWMDAEKLSQLLLELQKYADLVIVDSPSPEIADVQIFASKVNAVLLVIRLGQTRIESAQATLKRFQLIGARVIGAVLNQTPVYQAIDWRILSKFFAKQINGKDPYTANKEVDKVPISPP